MKTVKKLKIKNERQFAHIIQSSLVHKQDKEENKRLLLTEYVPVVANATQADKCPLIRNPMPHLGQGAYYLPGADEEAVECTGEGLVEHLKTFLKQNGYYKRLECKSNGRHTLRNVARAEYDKVVYTFAPWASNLYKKLGTHQNQAWVKKHFQEMASMAIVAYEDITGFKVAGACVHNEDVLHVELFTIPIKKDKIVNPTTGEIIEDNVLCSNKYSGDGVGGSKKYQNAGFGACGVMRYHAVAADRVYPKSIYGPVKENIDRKTKENGCLPPDLHLQQAVDSFQLDLINQHPSVRKMYDEEIKLWSVWKRSVIETTVEGQLEISKNNNLLLQNRLDIAKKVAGFRVPSAREVNQLAVLLAKRFNTPPERMERLKNVLKGVLCWEKEEVKDMDLAPSRILNCPLDALTDILSARNKTRGLHAMPIAFEINHSRELEVTKAHLELDMRLKAPAVEKKEVKARTAVVQNVERKFDR